MARPRNQELREFLLGTLAHSPANVAVNAAKRFGISRASVNGYLRALVDEGLIEATGRTNARSYRLKALDTYEETFPISPELKEDVVLRERVSPHLRNLPANVEHICDYGFTEMLNNAIEHSEGTLCKIRLSRNYSIVSLDLIDNGVGIFNKIARECHLADKRQAILELSKGKLTTDSRNHSGEGIFFTSRMFDSFSIMSGELRYGRTKQDNDEWLVESSLQKRLAAMQLGEEFARGTWVAMKIPTNAKQTAKEVFDEFVDDDARFSRTHVPLTLAKYEGENLVSRSQARRLLERVDRFSEVMLDFRGIAEIGQAFADEIFRVWAREHPRVKIVPENASPGVERMIRHASANAAEDSAAAAASKSSSKS